VVSSGYCEVHGEERKRDDGKGKELERERREEEGRRERKGAREREQGREREKRRGLRGIQQRLREGSSVARASRRWHGHV
jgi:hypothetical protein